MSVIVKTATIPFLSTTRDATGISDGQRSHAEANVLTASEYELARMSEETLARLRDRVRQVVAAPNDVADASGLEGKLTESRDVDSSAADLAADQVGLAIDQLVAGVLERSSSSVPVVLLFVGSEPNHHVDEVTARVAAALCDHAQSRVLLIDSDDVNRNLTAAARQTPQQGITEVIERDQEWRQTLMKNENSNLDFIPSGNGQFGRWNQKELLRKAVCEMKADYQFVCVAGGDAHGHASKLWSDVCDGSYLLVSVKNSNGMIAKSAVTELKASGARLLGCVVTDVEGA